jgi:hypothetical protein
VSPATAKTSRETEPPVFPTVPVMGPVSVVHVAVPELLPEELPPLLLLPLLLLAVPELLPGLPLEELFVEPLELPPELLPEPPPLPPPKPSPPPVLLLQA